MPNAPGTRLGGTTGGTPTTGSDSQAWIAGVVIALLIVVAAVVVVVVIILKKRKDEGHDYHLFNK